MSNGRVVPDTGEELLGPRVERVGVEPEVVDIEDGLRVGQVELGEVVENSGAWYRWYKTYFLCYWYINSDNLFLLVNFKLKIDQSDQKIRKKIAIFFKE